MDYDSDESGYELMKLLLIAILSLGNEVEAAWWDHLPAELKATPKILFIEAGMDIKNACNNNSP